MKFNSVLLLVIGMLVLGTSQVAAELVPFQSTGSLYILDHSCDCVLQITPTKDISIFLSESDITSVTGETWVHFHDNSIAFDLQGNMYFTESESNSILKWDASTQTLSILASEDDITAVTGLNWADPEGLAFGGDGFLYVTDSASESVLRVNPITGDVEMYVNKTQLENLPGINTVDLESSIIGGDNGIIYVASEGSPNAIFVIAPGGIPSVLTADPVFSDLDVFMTRAPNGDLIIADNAGADTIYRVTPDGQVSVFLSESQLESVSGGDVDLEGGIAFDSSGYFYIAEENSDSILRFDQFGNGVVWVSEDDIFNAVGIWPDFEAGIAFAPNFPPVCRYFTNPPTAKPYQQVVFDASESYDPDGNVVYTEWFFPDKRIPNEIAFYTFSQPGKYPVTLKVIDDDGLMCEETFFYEVTAQPPIVDFTFSPSFPELNQTITFNASSSYDPDGYITNYHWDFGDGTTASGVTVQHTYSQPGSYIVTLTVTDNDGLTSSVSKQITVTSEVGVSQSLVTRSLPSSVQLNSIFAVTIISTAPAIGMEIRETIPTGFTFVNYSSTGANSVSFRQSGNNLSFIITDMSKDGFTITYYLRAPSIKGNYTFSGTYETLGGVSTSIAGDIAVQVLVGEIILDNVNDTLEKIVTKYNPAFDWKTQTPTRQDIINAVVDAVDQYFSTSDQSARNEIVGDVVQLVTLYFSL